MTMQRPFICNSSLTACAISKCFFSYHHSRLPSFISSKPSNQNHRNILSLYRPFLTRFPAFRLYSSSSGWPLQVHIHNNKLPNKTVHRYRSLTTETPSRSSTTVNFSVDSDSDEEEENRPKPPPEKPKYKPLFDPFSKKPVIEDPKDPKDLQEVFHKMREEGYIPSAVKMFDGLSKDGLTHEAMKLFGELKDKGTLPGVVVHTAVVEAYCQASKPKEAIKTFMRMQAAGVKPNSYTYNVLIQGLCKVGQIDDAGKYAVEMLGQGWQPNVSSYTVMVELLVKEQKVAEARKLVGRMREKGFLPDEKAARQHLNKQRRFSRLVMDVLFGKF